MRLFFHGSVFLFFLTFYLFFFTSLVFATVTTEYEYATGIGASSNPWININNVLGSPDGQVAQILNSTSLLYLKYENGFPDIPTGSVILNINVKATFRGTDQWNVFFKQTDSYQNECTAVGLIPSYNTLTDIVATISSSSCSLLTLDRLRGANFILHLVRNLALQSYYVDAVGIRVTYDPPVTPTPTATPTSTPTPSPTSTPTPSPTPTVTPTVTPTPSPTLTPTPSPTLTPTPTPTPTLTPTPTIEPTVTPTLTPTVTLTPTPSPEPTMTPVPTVTPTSTSASENTSTPTPVISPTLTPVPSPISIANFGDIIPTDETFVSDVSIVPTPTIIRAVAGVSTKASDYRGLIAIGAGLATGLAAVIFLKKRRRNGPTK